MHTIAQLKDDPQFTFVSVREKSVSDAGSPCMPVAALRTDIQVIREIKHRTGDIILVTPYGFLRFWKDIQEKQ